MKNIKLLAMVIPLLIACTPEAAPGVVSTREANPIHKSLSHGPSNPLNPYDAAGAVRNRIVEATLRGIGKGPLTRDALLLLVSRAAEDDSDFAALKTPLYSTLTVPVLESFTASVQPPLQAVAGLPLSPKAKADLAGFIGGLLSLGDGDYDTLQGYILAFESAVLTEGSYSAGERKLILTVTSLERHGVHYRKKPKDKDWDLLIGNIIAGAQGACFDTATAIINSAATEAALHSN